MLLSYVRRESYIIEELLGVNPNAFNALVVEGEERYPAKRTRTTQLLISPHVG